MRRSGGEAPAETETLQRSDNKEFMTKAEYNRWLVRQQNAKMAEETRQMAKEGEDIIKERQRTHTAQGLSRQQAAMVQMKRASESLEAHRQQNLTHGRKVYEEVAGWRNGARQIKDDYATHGRNVMAQTKADNKTGAAIAEHMEHKKKQAADTRADDQKKQQELERLKKEREASVSAMAASVKAATSDAVIDASKRIFYEQRLKSAKETKTQSAAAAKERTERKAAWSVHQQKRRNKAKTARTLAKTARDNMASQKAAAAVTMRSAKQSLASQHKERMQQDYLNKAAAVKQVIADSIYNENDALGSPGSPKASPPKATGTSGRGSPTGEKNRQGDAPE